MSERTARDDCATALAELSRGRSRRVDAGYHDVDPSQLIDIAIEVRKELGSMVRIAWRDGAIQYVAT
jgi:hypothetical protein